MSFYKSFPLDPQRREIRVLTLHPGPHDAVPTATLKVISLDSNPSYNVLSYAWGLNTDLVSIQVEGQPFPVTRNLYQCLVNLRDETQELVIWIDAICINQGENAEKNTQVPLMRDVYRGAEVAFVWLGGGMGLEVVVRSIREVEKREGVKWERLEQLQEGLDVTPGELADAFNEFITLPWFRRTWIIQEFALPQQDPIFIFGPHRIASPLVHKWWQAVRSCNSRLRSHDELASGDPAWRKLHSIIGAMPLTSLNSVRMMMGMPEVGGKGLPLSMLISISEGAEATDRRDKIYGVMGLADGDVRGRIKVDYGRPVEELYEDASRHLIFQEGKLNILSNQSRDLQFIDPNNPTKAGYKLVWSENLTASWIRDFSYVRTSFRETALLPDWHGRGVIYDASFGSRPTGSKEQRRGELGIVGMQLDVVREVTRAWYNVPGKIQYFLDWEAILGVWFRAAVDEGVSQKEVNDGMEEEREVKEEGKGESRDEREDNSQNECQGQCEDENEGESEKKNKGKYANYNWNALYNPKDGPLKPIKEAIWRTSLGDKLTKGPDKAPSWCETIFTGYIDVELGNTDAKLVMPPESATSIEDGVELFSKFQRRVDTMLFRRAAIRTEDGWIGLAPDIAKEGDVVVILSGGDVPYVLRPEEDVYLLVGECYVEGVMYGEVLQARMKDKQMEGRIFRIR